MLPKNEIINTIAAAKGIPPLNPKTHVVVYTCRGWEFKTEPMSLRSAEMCLKDFQYANADHQFAAVVTPITI